MLSSRADGTARGRAARRREDDCSARFAKEQADQSGPEGHYPGSPGRWAFQHAGPVWQFSRSTSAGEAPFVARRSVRFGVEGGQLAVIEAVLAEVVAVVGTEDDVAQRLRVAPDEQPA